MTFARRLVAQRYLYGFDRNLMAADLAKVSRWLSTLARDHPFPDGWVHRRRCGWGGAGIPPPPPTGIS